MRRAGMALGLLLVGGGAWALTMGDRVYIRGRNVAVLQSAAPDATTLVKLQPGDAVVWRGADKKKPAWHKVEASGKSGFVYYANLSDRPPATELVISTEGAKKLDQQSFASSGAAGKGVAPLAEAYARQPEKNKGDIRPTMAEVLRQLQTTEAIAAQRTDEQLAAQAARIAGAAQ